MSNQDFTIVRKAIEKLEARVSVLEARPAVGPVWPAVSLPKPALAPIKARKPSDEEYLAHVAAKSLAARERMLAYHAARRAKKAP